MVYVIFKVAGVNLWSARLLSAVCGATLLCVVFLFLRRHTSGVPLVLGMVILAFEPLGLSLSRIAIPELPALLFTFLAFVALCARQRRNREAFVSGLCIAAAISMKGTTALVAPVFLLMATVTGAEGGALRRGLRGCAYLCGMALPALIGLAVALAAGQVESSPDSRLVVRILGGFFALGAPYDVAARFFGVYDTGNFNLLLLGLWLCSWLLIFRKELGQSACGEICLLSAIWCTGWLAVWSLMAYLPDRYFVHVILPLVINLVAGLALWRQIGVERMLAGIAAACENRRVALLFWLVLPAAVIIAVSSMPLANLAGFSIERMRAKVILLVVVACVMTAVLRSRGIGVKGVTGFIAFPVAASLLEMLARETSMSLFAWPLVEAVLPVVKLGIAVIVAWGVIAAPAGFRSAGAGSIVPALAVAIVSASLLFASSPVLFQPTYSMRDASQDLERRFHDARLVRSSGAGTLFIGTSIHYRDWLPPDQSVDAIVNFDQNIRRGPMYMVDPGYRIAIHPNYHPYGETRARIQAGFALVEVYRRRSTPTFAPRQPDQ